MILGQDLGALDGTTLETLARPILDGQALLSVPFYPIGKYEGLLNSGILYPFIRSLYGRQIRHPFAVDFGIAGSMVSQLATDTHRGQGSAILCPVIDGAVAGVRVAQVACRRKTCAPRRGGSKHRPGGAGWRDV